MSKPFKSNEWNIVDLKDFGSPTSRDQGRNGQEAFSLWGQVDVTPELVWSPKGIVTKVITYCSFNGYPSSSQTTLLPNGNLLDEHDTPEHGYTAFERTVAEHEEMAKLNKGSIHDHLVLGFSFDDVDRAMANVHPPIDHIFSDTDLFNIGLNRLEQHLQGLEPRYGERFLETVHRKLMAGKVYSVTPQNIARAAELLSANGLEERAQELWQHPVNGGYSIPGAEGFARYLHEMAGGHISTQYEGIRTATNQGIPIQVMVVSVKCKDLRIGTFYLADPIPATFGMPSTVRQMDYHGLIPPIDEKYLDPSVPRDDVSVHLRWVSHSSHQRHPRNGNWKDMVDFKLEGGRHDDHREIPFPNKPDEGEASWLL